MFVHLHLHSDYSLLDSTVRIPELIDHAIAANMPAVAVTDHGVLYGLIDFYQAARAKGIQPILGCEVCLADGDHRGRGDAAGREHPSNLILLAATDRGYQNLLRLVTVAHLDGFYRKPRIDRELLAAHGRGLIALSSGRAGAIGRYLLRGDIEAAQRVAADLSERMGRGNLFLELQDHGLAEDTALSRATCELGHRLQLPLVATNDVHYLRRSDARAHEVLLCLQTQSVMQDTERRHSLDDAYYFKTAAEMADAFREVPEALANTVRIAERCDVNLRLGELHFPQFPVPAGEDHKGYLLRLGAEGLVRRYGLADPVQPRSDDEKTIAARFFHELAIIERTRFINYFLVVADFVNHARKQGIPVGPGRGSGAGSLVAYALGITGIDPMRYGLLFERFLNPDRISPPDFDIDFCQERRGEVIEYVRRRYGLDHVAQIITFNTLNAKSLVRDIGRTLGLPLPQVDRLARRVQEVEDQGHHLALMRSAESAEDRRVSDADDAAFQQIMVYAPRLEGLHRSVSTHAAGVVIGPGPLVEFVPLCRDREGQLVTQYAMEPLRTIGLLKMDFLGLKTLTVIQRAVDGVKAAAADQAGPALDIEQIPLDDPATWALLKRGDTMGVFQLESDGMRDLVRRVGLDHLEDLMAMIALYRPGPMSMLEDYVARKTGKATTTYDHPALGPILKETYGVWVYQEQVLMAVHVLAGYSLAEADLFRRAMAKKDRGLMDSQRDGFIRGCARAHHIPAPLAERIFENVVRFAGYGFNKSHSAAYALLAYRTAYLKANHPIAFMTALLNSEMGNFDRLSMLLRETESMGVEVLPPDVNRSASGFMPDAGGIRFGLGGVKNVGENAARAIAMERETNGPYRGLLDTCNRLDGQTVNRRALESLVRSGAMDGFGVHRARLFQSVGGVLSRAAALAQERHSGQRALFECFDDPLAEAPDAALLPDCEPWTEAMMIEDEQELLGVVRREHPLRQYRWILEHFQLTTIHGLRQLADGVMTRVGGIVVGATVDARPATESAAAWAQLEDLDGTIEMEIEPALSRQYARWLAPRAAVLVCGQVRHRGNRVWIRLISLVPLADAPRQLVTRLSVHIASASLTDALLVQAQEVLCTHPGATPVTLCLAQPSGAIIFLETGKEYQVLADEAVVRELEQRFGAGTVYLEIEALPHMQGA